MPASNSEARKRKEERERERPISLACIAPGCDCRKPGSPLVGAPDTRRSGMGEQES